MNSTSSKSKKVAIIGYDGMRADALGTLRNTGVKGSNTDKHYGHNDNAMFSAINHLIDNDGYAYLSYAGGEKGKDTVQHTSTAPGWAAILTGVWGTKNGVKDNGDRKNMNYKTFLLSHAEKTNHPLKTTFIASWSVHFNDTYLNEVNYVKDKNIPLAFIEVENDKELHREMLFAVSEGEAEKDIIFGIYESPDYNGHGTNFSNTNGHYIIGCRNADNYAYEIIQTIQNRSTYENEDWLIILTSDHGGLRQSHGGQSL